ncbi:alpha/beta fold hydrolase [Actinokineospora bangkokensis]|uniref:alpha/beta fold hydrolase n=1 Tax=Actinokineospora bangkokensis TaxID=1193682 RepID=UPI001300D79E|nr:alpha/beta fold hydrolase [Actinokineospora bangkokensis]
MADIFRTSDGVALHVADSGPAGAPLTVVLAHGWTSDLRVWDEVVPLLTPHARVLRYDHRGHGRSGPAPRGSATLPRLSTDLAELLAERVPTGEVVLVGHSMGGMTMMSLAETHPDVVASLAGAVFVSTSAAEMDQLTFGLPRPLVRAVMKRRGKPRAHASAAAVVEGMNTRVDHDAATPDTATPEVAAPEIAGEPVLVDRAAPRVGKVQEVANLAFLRWLVFGSVFRMVDVRAVADQLGRSHRGTIGGLQRDILRHHSRVPALDAYQAVRTQVLVGEADRVTPLEHAHVIARALPDTEFVRYPGAGHMLPYERAPELANRVLRLVRSATRAPQHTV